MRTSFGGFLDFPTLEREGNEKKLDFEEGLKIAAENVRYYFKMLENQWKQHLES